MKEKGVRLGLYCLSASRLLTLGTRAVAEPVLDLEILHAAELAMVVGHDNAAERQGVRGDQQVAAADGLALGTELHADVAVDRVSRRLERQDLERAEDGLELLGQTG